MKKYSAPRADFITMSSVEPVASICTTPGYFEGYLQGPNPFDYFTLGEVASGCDDSKYHWIPGSSNT